MNVMPSSSTTAQKLVHSKLTDTPKIQRFTQSAKEEDQYCVLDRSVEQEMKGDTSQ
jgi:hypothetical protein